MYRKVIPGPNRAEKGGELIDQMDFTVQSKVGRRPLSTEQPRVSNRLQPASKYYKKTTAIT